MTLITDPAELREALRQIEPHRIAVAYVGSQDTLQGVIDWSGVQCLTVQPASCTSADAIETIREGLPKKGRLLFHDTLHAKVYLGDSAALVGSANLSHNGIGGGTVEACCLVTAPEDLSRIATFLDGVEAEAAKRFPPGGDNWNWCLQRLGEEPEDLCSLVEFNAGMRNVQAPSFLEYCSRGGQPFVVEWWEEDEELTLDAMKLFESRSHSISNSLSMKEKLHEGVEWILCWRCKKDGTPRAKIELEFMHVDRQEQKPIYKRQTDIYQWSVVELRPLAREMQQPFRIDDAFREAFRAVVASDGVGGLFRPKGSDDPGWNGSECMKAHGQNLMEELRAAYLAQFK